jgi:hypothetical protein
MMPMRLGSTPDDSITLRQAIAAACAWEEGGAQCRGEKGAGQVLGIESCSCSWQHPTDRCKVMLCGWRVASSEASKQASKQASHQASPLGTKVFAMDRAQELAQVHHMVLNAISSHCRPCIRAAGKVSACSYAGKHCKRSGGGPATAGGAPPSDGSDAVRVRIHRTCHMMSSL